MLADPSSKRGPESGVFVRCAEDKVPGKEKRE
jgi:hypothetical protein